MLGLCCSMDLSLVAASEGYFLVAMYRFLIVVASGTAEHKVWGMQAQESRLPGPRAQAVVVAHRLSCPKTRVIVLEQGSNCVSCIGRQILYI